MLEFLAKKKSNKVIDSSVLIDGRIFDIFKTGFLDNEGVIIPLFVLEEVQRLADSRDHAKRLKGKVGLETAKKVQELTGADRFGRTSQTYDRPHAVHSMQQLHRNEALH